MIRGDLRVPLFDLRAIVPKGCHLRVDAIVDDLTTRQANVPTLDIVQSQMVKEVATKIAERADLFKYENVGPFGAFQSVQVDVVILSVEQLRAIVLEAAQHGADRSRECRFPFA